jgi:hypothetical protein
MKSVSVFRSYLLLKVKPSSYTIQFISSLSLSAINNNRAKRILVFVSSGQALGAADVGKRPRKPGQQLIKKFLKHELTGRHIKRDERRRSVSKSAVVIFDLFLMRKAR